MGHSHAFFPLPTGKKRFSCFTSPLPRRFSYFLLSSPCGTSQDEWITGLRQPSVFHGWVKTWIWVFPVLIQYLIQYCWHYTGSLGISHMCSFHFTYICVFFFTQIFQMLKGHVVYTRSQWAPGWRMQLLSWKTIVHSLHSRSRHVQEWRR